VCMCVHGALEHVYAVPRGGLLLNSDTQKLMISREHAKFVLVGQGQWKVGEQERACVCMCECAHTRMCVFR
jgi:hypothetical protein